MLINSPAQAGARPRTYVGQWLLAGMLDQRAERQRLGRMLNNGRSGWNPDEPAVVGFAFEMAVRRLFPESVDVPEITLFVEELRSRVQRTSPPDQLEAEVLIRDALGEPVDIGGISAGKIFTTHAAILGFAIQKLALGESDIKQLILESERIAFKQGWNPPLAELRKRDSGRNLSFRRHRHGTLLPCGGWRARLPDRRSACWSCPGHARQLVGIDELLPAPVVNCLPVDVQVVCDLRDWPASSDKVQDFTADSDASAFGTTASTGC
jgi:hypothetical protein